MKLGTIYQRAVRFGMARDPRSPADIRKQLRRTAAQYRKLSGAERKAFDRERLTNPYADTRILGGDLSREVRTIMVGIDMESEEIMLADRLNERGAAIDLVMAHHPEGLAWASLADVMGMQALILKRFGIPLDIAEGQLKDRSDEVARSLSAANHARSVDVARLVGMPFMCVHTPADNHVVDYLERLFAAERPRTLSRVLRILYGIPEYADAMKKNAGPRILIGKPSDEAGKIFVDMTGGTEGPKRIFPRLSQAGVRTIVGMHLSEEHYKIAKDEHINVVIAGHIASDNLGMNLMLDAVGGREPFKVIPCSGFIRVIR